MTDSTIEAPATPRLKQQYKDVIVPELEKEFKYSNPMQVARVQKVVVSMASALRPATPSSSKAPSRTSL